ncbi:MAG: RDD family protein [Gordonia sp. (in: high G+C Gram-positive bacteria)]|uniref:RDD family protein n=1 Tax=Gordonia TaxID=2053 RepID=UPI0032675598
MTYPPGPPNPADPTPDPFAQTQIGPTAQPFGDGWPPAPGSVPAANPYDAPQFGSAPYGEGAPWGAEGAPWGDSPYAPGGTGGAHPGHPSPPGYPAPAGWMPMGSAGSPPSAPGYGPSPGSGHAQIATIGQRFLARLLDTVLYAIVYGIGIGLGIGALAESMECHRDAYGYQRCTDPSGAGIASFLILVAVVLVIGLLYEWLMIGLVGATLGKMAVRLRVVDQYTGQPIGLGSAFVRQLIPFLGAFVCIGQLVVYLSPLFDSSGRMQGWHDKAANDLVIVRP